MTKAEKHEPGRRRRRDFEKNRETILRAAIDSFAELGSSVSINEIAERAGVAPATIYRHFPNRDALVKAVFNLRVAEYADAIEAARAATDPSEAFRGTIHAIVQQQARDRSFREMLNAQRWQSLDSSEFARFVFGFSGALYDARAENVIRDSVADEDIMLLLMATERVARTTNNKSPSALRRLVDVLLDGICNDRAEPTGETLTFEQLLDATGD